MLKGTTQSEKAKKKVSTSLKKFFNSVEGQLAKQNLRKIHLGTKHSKSAKRKIALINKGKKFSKEHKRKIGKAQKGSKNHNWKGGRQLTSGGYIQIFRPEHPFSDKRGYIRESRLVAEKHLGRYLKPKEIIHHVNGIPDDNRIKNLQLFPNNTTHLIFHNTK